MSDIHLNRFRHLAQLATDQPNTRIEFDDQKGSVREQKSSLSAQIGRFFTRHSVLLKRTENAAFAFYRALQNEYGEHIAKEAVSDLRGFRIINGQVTVDASHFLTADTLKSGLEVAGALQNQITHARQEPVSLPPALAVENPVATPLESQTIAPPVSPPVAAPRTKLQSPEPSTTPLSVEQPIAAPRAHQSISAPTAAQQSPAPIAKPRVVRPTLAATPTLETIPEDAQEDVATLPTVDQPTQVPVAAAKPKGPPPPPRKPTKEYFEARARQEIAWKGLFGKESTFPASMEDAKTQLQAFITNNDALLKKSHWGADSTANTLWTGWQGAQSALLSEVEKTHHFALTLEEFHRDIYGFSVDLAKELSAVNITVVPHGIEGEGGIGKAVEVKVDGQRKIKKEFKEDREYPLQLDVSATSGQAKLVRSSELTAAFLHPNEFEVIIAPSHFLVEETSGAGSTQYLVEVRDKEFRAWAKHRLTEHADDEDYELSIVGNLQDVAPGEELFTTFTKASPTLDDTDAKHLAGELLYAMAVLGERGFVHGDLKPENIYYDSASKKLKLIDTGGLSKISKEPGRVLTTAFLGRRGHTTIYSIPKVSSYTPIGLEQDLFATGILLLEVDSVRHYCATGDETVHQKFELFQNELSKIHARLKIGDLNATEAADAVRQALTLAYPLTNGNIENVGLEAIFMALNYSALTAPPDIDQHLKNIEDLIDKL